MVMFRVVLRFRMMCKVIKLRVRIMYMEGMMCRLKT